MAHTQQLNTETHLQILKYQQNIPALLQVLGKLIN